MLAIHGASNVHVSMVTVSNCTGSRTLIQQNGAEKKTLQESLTRRRRSSSELLSVESDILHTISFTDIAETVATTKSRKRLQPNTVGLSSKPN